MSLRFDKTERNVKAHILFFQYFQQFFQTFLSISQQQKAKEHNVKNEKEMNVQRSVNKFNTVISRLNQLQY